MAQHSPFLPLLLITVRAVVLPELVSHPRLGRWPLVVGDILAGVGIGKSGLDLVQSTPTLTFLAEFGFPFLMFLSGLEVSLKTRFVAVEAAEQRPYWQRPLPLAGRCFLATILLALLVGLGLAQLGLARQPLLLGLILSPTSLGMVVPVLKERGLTATGYGQVVLVTALLSDFVTLLLLRLLIAVLRQGLSLDLRLFLGLLGRFAAAAKLGHWVSRGPGLTRVTTGLSPATGPIQGRGAVALMVRGVVGAEALGGR